MKDPKPVTLKLAGEIEIKPGTKAGEVSEALKKVNEELGKIGTGNVKAVMLRGVLEV